MNSKTLMILGLMSVISLSYHLVTRDSTLEISSATSSVSAEAYSSCEEEVKSKMTYKTSDNKLGQGYAETKGMRDCLSKSS